MIQNLEYYRTFYYAATMGSFSSAAEAMFVSQSAVSQTIKKLERELSCALFERNHSQVRLTEDGELLLSHVKRALLEFQEAEKELLQRSNRKNAILTIGATEAVLHYGIPEKLKEFQRKHPNVQVDLCGNTTPELLEDLRQGTLEAAFLIATPDMLQSDTLRGLKLQHLAVVQDRALVSKSLGLSSEYVYELRDLMGYSFVAHNEKNSVRHLITQWFLRSGLVFEPRFSVSSTAQVLKMVECGLGIGVLPEVFLKTNPEEIMALQTVTLPEPRELILVCRAGEISPLIGELYTGSSEPR